MTCANLGRLKGSSGGNGVEDAFQSEQEEVFVVRDMFVLRLGLM